MITAAHLERAEEVLAASYRLGMDPKHAHQMLSNRVRIEQATFNNWIMSFLGQTSRHLAKADGPTQKQAQEARDIILAAALRQAFALGVVAQRLSEGNE